MNPLKIEWFPSLKSKKKLFIWKITFFDTVAFEHAQCVTVFRIYSCYYFALS